MTVSQTSLQPPSPPSVKSNSGLAVRAWMGGSLFIFFLCEFPSLKLEGKNQQNPHLPYQTQSLSPHVKVAPSLKLVSWLFVFIETPLQFLKISAQKICLNFCRVWLNSYFVRRLFEYLLGRQLFKSQTVLTGNLLQ